MVGGPYPGMEDGMKTAMLFAGMLAAMAANVAAAEEPGFSVTVTASGLN